MDRPPEPGAAEGHRAPAAGAGAPAWYAIRVVGANPPAPAVALEGFRRTVSAAGGATVTELVGEVLDSAGPLPALRSLHEQRLILLAVDRLPGPPAPERTP